MRFFVVGTSHTGKSPFARRLAGKLGVRALSAGEWVRERAAVHGEARPGDAATPEARAAHVARLSSLAIDELRRDPGVSVASLRARLLAPDEPVVVDGMRNPYDFVHTFDSRTDRVVFLTLTTNAPPQGFERGVEVIRDYVAWLADLGMVTADQVSHYKFSEYGGVGDYRPETLEHAIINYLGTVSPFVPTAAVPRSRVHADIPKFKTHVRAEFLHDLDASYVGQTQPCSVFSISSYVGQAPTFQIRLADGAVFSYLPAHALVDVERAMPPMLDLDDLVYHNCKHLELSVHVADSLVGPVLAYFKRRDLWLAGTYRFTVDWFTGNEMLHCLALENGQTALLPSHKVKFGDHPPGFAPYKKLRREWVVGG